MQMHWILTGAAKQRPVTYSREDSTYGDLATVASVHMSCNGVAQTVIDDTMHTGVPFRKKKQ